MTLIGHILLMSDTEPNLVKLVLLYSILFQSLTSISSKQKLESICNRFLCKSSSEKLDAKLNVVQ